MSRGSRPPFPFALLRFWLVRILPAWSGIALLIFLMQIAVSGIVHDNEKVKTLLAFIDMLPSIVKASLGGEMLRLGKCVFVRGAEAQWYVAKLTGRAPETADARVIKVKPADLVRPAPGTQPNPVPAPAVRNRTPSVPAPEPAPIAPARPESVPPPPPSPRLALRHVLLIAAAGVLLLTFVVVSLDKGGPRGDNQPR